MDALEKLNEHFLSCNICTEIFKDPCTIGCYHTFCRECLTKYTKTRRDALNAQSILCPTCNQMTKVPRPQEPVDLWCQQFKPSFLIQGLLDTFTSQELSPQEIASPVTYCCLTCQQIGKTTPATSVCRDCDFTLCNSCATKHDQNNPSGHTITPLDHHYKPAEIRQVLCSEHNKVVEYCCQNCMKAICQKCRIMYHKRCHSVVPMESMIPQMKEVLQRSQAKINSECHTISKTIADRKGQLEKIGEQKSSLQADIERASGEIIAFVKEQERRLLEEIDEMVDHQADWIKGDIKSWEIDQQTYEQYGEFIKHVLSSKSPMDLYDIFVVCRTGDITGDRVRHQRGDEIERKVTFKKDFDITQLVKSLKLGHLSMIDEDFYEHCVPKFQRTLDIEGDKMTPYPTDVVVLDVEGTTSLVVTDCKNNSVKFYYKKDGETNCKPLKLKHQPRSVTKLEENKLVISFLSHNSFVLVKVTPDPILLSTIQTQKKYKCLAAINDTTLAAGSKDPPSIDILDLSGRVLRSVLSSTSAKKILQNPLFMCTTKLGNIVVTDWEYESVMCVTQGGKVVFTHKLTGTWGGGCGGVTATDTGTVFVVDYIGNKIIQLSETRGYVRDLLTSKGGIDGPQGICFYKNKLYVTEWNRNIKVFRLAAP